MITIQDAALMAAIRNRQVPVFLVTVGSRSIPVTSSAADVGSQGSRGTGEANFALAARRTQRATVNQARLVTAVRTWYLRRLMSFLVDPPRTPRDERRTETPGERALSESLEVRETAERDGPRIGGAAVRRRHDCQGG